MAKRKWPKYVNCINSKTSFYSLRQKIFFNPESMQEDHVIRFDIFSNVGQQSIFKIAFTCSIIPLGIYICKVQLLIDKVINVSGFQYTTLFEL